MVSSHHSEIHFLCSVKYRSMLFFLFLLAGKVGLTLMFRDISLRKTRKPFKLLALKASELQCLLIILTCTLCVVKYKRSIVFFFFFPFLWERWISNTQAYIRNQNINPFYMLLTHRERSCIVLVLFIYTFCSQ